MTARADDAERRLAAIELRLAGIDILLVDARRWLNESLMSGENAHLEGTSEAVAHNRLLNALEHADASAGEDTSFRCRRPTKRTWCQPPSEPG
jgi:hypothetical protein